MTPLKLIGHPIWCAHQIGSWFVIDFGLAGLFERFEQTFGVFLTKCLTVLIGLAIASACLNVMWSFVGSFMDWALGYEQASPSSVARLIVIVANIVALVVASAMIASLIEFKTRANLKLRELQEATKQSEKALLNFLETENSEEARKRVTTLKQALKDGSLEKFIKEHEADPKGDLDKLDAVIKRPTQENGKATRPASSQDASDG